MEDWKKIQDWIMARDDKILELQRGLTAIPALAPENGGDGEKEKADFLCSWLKKNGFPSVERVEAPDARVSGKSRPTVITGLEGKTAGPTFWIMTHLDVVPPGDLNLWEGDPYTLREEGGRLYGRGTEDNQQGMTASIFALLSLIKNGITPKNPVKLLFVADEEVGSAYGIKYLLRETELFSPGDTFLVPDGGNPDGTMLEIAEKSVLWIEFSTHGKQCHASMPHLGRNAFVAASELVGLLHGLREDFPERNDLFDPPCSTFVPTKKLANVPNVNTLPGEDVFCLDTRILPQVPLERVLGKIEEYIRRVEEKHGVTVSTRILQRVESRPTSGDSNFVRKTGEAIKSIGKREAILTGIGGGTVGAYLRNAGYDTVVWSTIDETAHMPNEYSLLSNLKKDALVMAYLMTH